MVGLDEQLARLRVGCATQVFEKKLSNVKAIVFFFKSNEKKQKNKSSRGNTSLRPE